MVDQNAGSSDRNIEFYFRSDVDYCVKVFDKRIINDKSRRQTVQDEINIVACLDCEHCVKFHSMKNDENLVLFYDFIILIRYI